MKLLGRALLSINRLSKVLLIVILEHLPIFIILILYLGYTFYIECNYVNIDIHYYCEISLPMFLSIITMILLLFIGKYSLMIIKTGIDSLYHKLIIISNKYLNLNRIASFMLIYLMYVVDITLFQNLKKAIPIISPFCYDVLFAKLDYILHFNHHPWVILLPILANTIAIRVIDFLYFVWFILISIITFWLSASNRRKLRMQYFMTLFLIFFIIGNLLATVFSSAGPCYYGKVIGVTQQDPYKQLMDNLHSIDDNSPITALELQDSLWDNYVNKKEEFAKYISAMPSIHVAVATLFALTFSKVNIYIGLIFWIYWAIIQIGSIILGWHYAVDGYFATLLTIGLWKISGYFNNRFLSQLPEKYQAKILRPDSRE